VWRPSVARGGARGGGTTSNRCGARARLSIVSCGGGGGGGKSRASSRLRHPCAL